MCQTILMVSPIFDSAPCGIALVCLHLFRHFVQLQNCAVVRGSASVDWLVAPEGDAVGTCVTQGMGGFSLRGIIALKRLPLVEKGTVCLHQSSI